MLTNAAVPQVLIGLSSQYFGILYFNFIQTFCPRSATAARNPTHHEPPGCDFVTRRREEIPEMIPSLRHATRDWHAKHWALFHDLLVEFSVEFLRHNISPRWEIMESPLRQGCDRLRSWHAKCICIQLLGTESVSLPSLRPSGVGESCESCGSGGAQVVTLVIWSNTNSILCI